jgi:hypothetical protein
VGKRKLNFTGHVFGELSFTMALSVEGADGAYERSAGWDEFDTISLQRAYEYLGSIDYFTPPHEEELPENPNLKKKEWTEIYTNDYSFVRAKIID